MSPTRLRRSAGRAAAIVRVVRAGSCLAPSLVRAVRAASILALCAFALGGTLRRAVAAEGFYQNLGQLDSRASFYAPGSRLSVYFVEGGFVLDLKEASRPPEARVLRGGTPSPALRGGTPPFALPGGTPSAAVRHACAVYFRIEGPASAVVPEGRSLRTERTSFFLGQYPARWRRLVPSMDQVVYRGAVPGGDLVFRREQGALRWTVEGASGEPLSVAVRFSRQGASRIEEAGGVLRMDTPAGVLVQEDLDSGGRISLEGDGGTPSRSADLFQPHVSGGSREAAVLAWSSFLGGSSDELATAVALARDGGPVVTGLTISTYFPTTPGAYDESYNGFGDVFVSRFDPSGSRLLWSTFLGGTAPAPWDYGYGIALDGADNPVITGLTGSADFPVTPGSWDQTLNGAADVFVSKLSADGGDLLWSTFLGGADHDIGYGVALTPAGSPLIAGRTLSPDFPTGHGTTPTAGEEDGFVARLKPDGSGLLWSRLIGGTAYDGCEAIALDSGEHILVAGYTASSDFPATPGAYDTSFNGGLYDAFASRLSPDGTVLWTTLLGGGDYEYANAIAVDSQGNPVLAGATASSDFPVTPGAFDPTFNGGQEDAWVAKLDSGGAFLQWATFLGGTTGVYETAFGLALDSGGRPVVAGTTPSPDFPIVPGAWDATHNGANDAFVARLNAAGSALEASTFLGGTGNDYAWTLALDEGGRAVVAGSTDSEGFPTTPGAFDQTYNGGDGDAFVARLEFLDPAAAEDGLPPARLPATIPLSVLPNPVAGAARARFTLGTAGWADLELYDVRGRVLCTLASRVFPAGVNEIPLDFRGPEAPASGVYYLRVHGSAGEGTTEVRLVGGR